jgi:anti-sigma factor RsiW
MSCSPYDLKDYFLGELSEAERQQVQRHAQECGACREELDRLRLTQAALRALPEEEPPRRIAFVSDKVFEPGWWQRFWQSGSRLGFASAAMLSIAILGHALLRPPAVAPPGPPGSVAIEARISAEVAKQLEPVLARASAESEARQAKQMIRLVTEAEQRIDFDRRADRVAFEEAFSVLQKRLNVMYTASANLGGRP